MPYDILNEPFNDEILRARYVGEEGKLLITPIAKDLIYALNLITIKDNKEIMYYENGIYNSGGYDKVLEILCLKFQDHIKKYHVNEIILKIQGRTMKDRSIFNSNRDLIHLNNGIFNIKTSEFMEFSPDIYATNKIPVDYDTNAECPKIDKFLSEVLSECDIKIIYELFAYVLYKGYPFQKAFMFMGSGANGKSTLINLFHAFIGKHNISNKSLQDLGTDRFASSELYGKLANLYPDLSDKGLESTGVFKALTGGDSIDAQRKFQSSFSFENHAKLIFSCNKLPWTKDDTDAFFRRWIIIDFPNTFSGENADNFLIDKITHHSELSGLFNVAIKTLPEMIERGGFSHSDTTEKTKDVYIRLSNPLRSFVMDYVVSAPGEWITKEKFYSKYVEYCSNEGIKPRDISKVGRDLPSMVRVIEEKHKVDNIAKKCWGGIQFKGIVEEKMEQTERLSIVKDFATSMPDGFTLDELVDELDGTLNEESVNAIVKHLLNNGLSKFGDVYQWLG